ncbi:patatin-like phospholipase family protein [Formosa algae]|uniref:NTE family protein n=1 Tax=Formosa algae TaxID=225843 RepID=A0A9X0YHH8_9FLAO|nr:patatin-like phospholipase family protein [Formosa algae]MBP1838316.1 NTE family protein [Formosa algae]MDQ0334451.1 NTE family protein [Formosa algae]OEI82150.1 patatin [Formosa algae]
MNNLNKFFILLSCILLPILGNAQDKDKPKVALVLSGGGALGIAHIPTLQKLDSLGIVPDLIIGTSMGSIVGALYSIGYTGDEIAELSKTTDWDALFGGKVSINSVSNEEKSEFGRYSLGFEVIDKKPKPVLAILNDQNLREFFSVITFPVYNVTDFDKFPIPFRAMATDIVNGKQVVISKGSLTSAMRASMSIPGVFKPVEYENTLLVDGGVLNNFPVDIAQQLGADFIIGSEVSGGLQPKEKLSNLETLLLQTGMLSSNLLSEKNKQACDILIDNVPNLKFTPGDFDKSEMIYEQGKKAVLDNEDKFKALADMLKPYKQRKHEKPEIQEYTILDTIVYKGISKNNLRLVQCRSGLEEKKEYSIDQARTHINRILGTNLFSAIYANPILDKDYNGLEITVKEKAHNQVKVAAHFDDYRGVGLIFNYTGRNIIGASSRILTTLDIAEQPKFKIQYQKIFGKNKDFWFRSEIFGEKLDQDVIVSGETVDEMNYKYLQFDNEINRNIHTLNSYAGLGIDYQSTVLKPEADPDILNNVFNLVNYKYRTLEVYGQYTYNTLNEVFIPTKGLNIEAKIGRTIANDVEASFYDRSLSSNQSGRTNGFTKFRFHLKNVETFRDNLSLILGANIGFTFLDKLEANDISFLELGYGANYYLGGNLQRPRKDDFVFYGLLEDELPVTQFISANVALQYQFLKKLYLTPHFDIASVGFSTFNNYTEDAFKPKGEWKDNIETSELISLGTKLTYNSMIGPIGLDFTWVNSTDKFRVFFGIGIPLGR